MTENRIKKVDRLTKCVGITISQDDHNRLVDYMNLHDITESTALREILINHLFLDVDPTEKWKNNGESRQMKMYLSSRIYTSVRKEATKRHMKTSAYIRSVIYMYLRSEAFDFDLKHDRIYLEVDDDDEN